MNPIRSNPLGGLEWRQNSALSRSYELSAGDSLLARLQFQSLFGSLALADTGESSWTFKRTGFLTPVVTARRAGDEEDVATYEPNWSGNRGRLHLAGGETLLLRSTNFWNTEWSLRDGNDHPLLVFHNRGMLQHGATVEASEKLHGREDAGLLICLTWYVLLLYMQDAAVAAG